MTRRRAAVRPRQVAARPRRAAGAPRSSDSRREPTATVATEQTGAATDAEPQALVASHWFDSGDTGEPYAASVRFIGKRAGIHGRPGIHDQFVHDEVIDPVVPGTGPVAITATVYGLEPGDWSVDAQLLPSLRAGEEPRARSKPSKPSPIPPAAWSWRHWAISTRQPSLLKTRWALTAPLARTPAVMPGVYPALALIGAVVALATQAAILSRESMVVGPSLATALVAMVAGLVGAKAWYAILHPDESIIRGGWAVDGFLVVAPVAMVAALHASSLPMGVVLDASTPGLFLAVAIGRVGCFVTGCCAGRCTSSRLGIWSSDRRVGARRIPVQLVESGTGLLLGLASLVLVLRDALPAPGLVFVLSFAGYTAVRQVLLRLRAEERRSARTVPLTAAAAAAILIAVAMMATVESSEPAAQGFERAGLAPIIGAFQV